MYLKAIVTVSFIFISIVNAMAQLGSDFKLPATWEKDFVVNVSHTGSMSGGESEIRVTYDSIIYTVSSRKSGESETRTYLMKEKDRAELMAKFREFRVDKIKVESHFAAVNDGWQHSICFGSHCVEGGTSVKMSEKNKDNFLNASAAIENLAIKKTK